MTNYDKELQTMTIDKYAAMMFSNRGHNCERCPIYEQCEGFTCGSDCKKKIRKWLESKVVENEK